MNVKVSIEFFLTWFDSLHDSFSSSFLFSLDWKFVPYFYLFSFNCKLHFFSSRCHLGSPFRGPLSNFGYLGG